MVGWVWFGDGWGVGVCGEGGRGSLAEGGMEVWDWGEGGGGRGCLAEGGMEVWRYGGMGEGGGGRGDGWVGRGESRGLGHNLDFFLLWF